MHLREVVTLARHDRASCLALAAALEAGAAHPVARALLAVAAGQGAPRAAALTHVAGGGVEGEIDGRRMRIGTPQFVAELSGKAPPASLAGVGEEQYRRHAR